MDACKLHSNVDREHCDAQRPVRGHCAFCEGIRGGGRVPGTRMCAAVIIRSRFFSALFPRKLCLRDTPWLRGTMIRDRHEYNLPSVPSPFIPCLSSSSFCCYAKRYPHSVLAKPCASYNVIVADTVMVVNTFQSSGARTADMLHDSQSTARSSRGCCGSLRVWTKTDHYSFLRDADPTYLWLTAFGITQGIPPKNVGEAYKHIREEVCIQAWQPRNNAESDKNLSNSYTFLRKKCIIYFHIDDFNRQRDYSSRFERLLIHDAFIKIAESYLRTLLWYSWYRENWYERSRENIKRERYRIFREQRAKSRKKKSHERRRCR
jgi:hypothetical protein